MDFRVRDAQIIKLLRASDRLGDSSRFPLLPTSFTNQEMESDSLARCMLSSFVLGDVPLLTPMRVEQPCGPGTIYARTSIVRV